VSPPRSPRPCGSADDRLLDPDLIAKEFTDFYRTSAPRLVAYLRWQGASLPDAADVVQEALVLAFTKWSTLAYPFAWCRMVATRIYLRRLREMRESPVEDVQAVGSALLVEDAEFEALEARQAVLGVLAQLPPRQRQVMAWTLDGARTEEIAAALDMNQATVRSTLRAARLALQTRMRK